MRESPDVIRDDPAIKKLFSRIPVEVSDSFDDLQLLHLKTALSARQWGSHAMDLRGTFKIPLIKWRFYYVFLLGKNHRELSRSEERFAIFSSSVFITFFLVFSILLGLLILYLLKSAAGIDIFPGFSLGIWSWFKNL